ncbi:tumor necrosis factor alpha-induced protein 8-like protein 1 [Lingula anatina]|uniref:Tumor necrosis factor alpha-induced protein 8-like protein 1 n=1 Tax=Lingula anatina TaxID=7574 RepID=A0A1S3IUH9_LINAN|nr:tumor necrosis factor alpha-induced protein 8-like protein 1 [Lingula anatina]XP_013401586.1 tumor necrosis factor alpha-induced protein 8-like protein 1 [Lingula anatina]XP_013401587.1 tumor necrosis factor alpha-induced protein 8-like protein 1 [Lingula anatina]|eukprot:XP_013401585.1 tumor necrosis factor alpha-induced protein 8-like protein 1 [Lingula anatina]
MSDQTVPGAGFNSKGLGLRAQKKLMGKLASKKIAKVFIDDTTGHMLDQLFFILKDYTKSKKEGEKLLKDIIKIVIKIGILYRNDQFDAEELALAERFKKKFHTCAMTVMSFFEVEFSFDKNFLSRNLRECHAMLTQLIRRHLTDKSHTRLNHVFDFFSDPEFLETVFRMDSVYRDSLGQVVNDLHKMMEDGTI